MMYLNAPASAVLLYCIGGKANPTANFDSKIFECGHVCTVHFTIVHYSLSFIRLMSFKNTIVHWKTQVKLLRNVDHPTG